MHKSGDDPPSVYLKTDPKFDPQKPHRQQKRKAFVTFYWYYVIFCLFLTVTYALTQLFYQTYNLKMLVTLVLTFRCHSNSNINMHLEAQYLTSC